MDIKKNYYSILGISPTSNADQIRKAYRLLALKHHPDHNQDSKLALIKFESIKEAYEILMDVALKRQYDSARRSMALSPLTYQRELRGFTKNTTSTSDTSSDEMDTIQDVPLFEKQSFIKPVILLILSLLITLIIILFTKK